MTLHLAIIIVSYNTRELLRACLESIEQATARAADALMVSTLVVDNDSADGSATMVAESFPQVRLFALEENLGFTSANNFALDKLSLLPESAAPATAVTNAAPDFVLLLNPDTQIVGDALPTLVRFIQSHPHVGICGPALAFGDGAFQHAAFAFPSVAQVALDLFPLQRLPLVRRLYDSRVNGRYPAALWQRGRPFAVDFVLGAALLVRADVVRAIGGLDDAYFMYCEEMDWCLRARNAGWDVFAVPQARIIHYEAQSSRQQPWLTFERLWRSRLRFYDRHADSFITGTPTLVRLLLRIAMHMQRMRARRRFGRGVITGMDAAHELAAIRTVSSL